MSQSALMIREVSRTTLKLWRRELAKTLSIPERVVSAGLGALLLLGVLVSGGLLLITNLFLAELGEGTFEVDPRPLLRLVFAGVFCGAAAYQLILGVTTPNRTSLDNLLSLLPIKRHLQVLGGVLPMFFLGLVFSVLLGLPSLGLLVRLAEPIGAVAAFVWVVLIVTLTVPSVFLITRTSCQRHLRLPANYALGVAAAVTAGFVATIAGRDLIPQQVINPERWWSIFTPGRAVTDVISDNAPSTTAGWLAVIVWTALALAAFIVMPFIKDPTDDQDSTRILVGLEPPRFRRRAQLWFEVVTLARLPQFAVTVLLVIVGTTTIPIMYSNPAWHSIGDQAAGVFMLIPATLAMYSFGVTHRVQWSLHLPTANKVQWILPKAIAGVLIPAALVFPFVTVMLLVGMEPSRLLDAMVMALAMVGAGLLCGMLVPFISTVSFSATVTSATTVVTWALVTVGLRLLAGLLGWDNSLVVTLAAAMLLFSAYFWTAIRSAQSLHARRA